MMAFVGAGRSHARRDALDPMLIEAAERAGERRLAAALKAERAAGAELTPS